MSETLSRRGLRFENAGARATLPSGVDSVVLTAGGFAGPVKVEARNNAGSVIFTRTHLPANTPVTVLVRAPGMIQIELTAGGGEGSLVDMIVPC